MESVAIATSLRIVSSGLTLELSGGVAVRLERFVNLLEYSQRREQTTEAKMGMACQQGMLGEPR